MLVDKYTSSFSEATHTTSTHGDTIDLLTTGYHGHANPLYFCVSWHSMTIGGNRAYSVKLEDGTAFTDSGGVTTGKADVEGTRIQLPTSATSGFAYTVVSGTENLNRYIQADLDVAGTSPSITLTAWITGEVLENHPFYDDRVTFSANA